MTSHAESLSHPSLEISKSPDTLGGIVRYFASRTSPLILIGWAVASVSARLYVGRFTVWDLAICAAILAWWPFQEWLIHVFVLHFRPRKIGKWKIDLFVSKKHRRHHKDPWRIDILFIPAHTYLFSIPFLLLFWLGLMPTIPLALTGLAFTGLLALHYEWVHFMVHTRYRPKSAFYKRLWRNHRLHHCKNEHYWMGVTMLMGDRVLGTAKNKREVPTSDTCRTLGYEEDLGTA